MNVVKNIFAVCVVVLSITTIIGFNQAEKYKAKYQAASVEYEYSISQMQNSINSQNEALEALEREKAIMQQAYLNAKKEAKKAIDGLNRAGSKAVTEYIVDRTAEDRIKSEEAANAEFIQEWQNARLD